MTEFVDNPPWLTKAIADVYDVIQKKVPPEWLPRMDNAKSRRGKFTAEMKEYGCGVYGCVIPTLDPGIVLKATTDTTETEFAAELGQSLVVPVVVEYHMVVALAAKHHGARVSLLWRESAEKVGELEKGSLKKVIEVQHHAATRVLLAIKQGVTQRKILGPLLEQWMARLDKMAEHPELRYVATGMQRVWREQSIALLDVHAGNLGLCDRSGRKEWVVTDPGNVVVIE